MSIQEQKTRKRRRNSSGKFKLRVRYKGHIYTTIETEDYGSFKQMYEKYKGQYQFWCGDQPPVKEYTEGTYNGYRLDSDIRPEHIESTLKRYGRHKCWIDPNFKVDGKMVCLVFNAARAITFRRSRRTGRNQPITVAEPEMVLNYVIDPNVIAAQMQLKDDLLHGRVVSVRCNETGKYFFSDPKKISCPYCQSFIPGHLTYFEDGELRSKS